MSASQVKPLRFTTGVRAAYVIVWAVWGLLCVGLALVSYRYLLQLGGVPPVIEGNLFIKPWLVVHVAGSATALLIGPLQFSSRLRTRFGALHRWIGRVYVVACLVGGASGFVLALGASTGPISTVGFGSLAIVWIVTTSFAWRRATQGRFIEHRAWMIRSFALTFAAVTLRLYLPLHMLFTVHFDDAYRAISFLCWVPNLLVAELYLRKKASRAPEVQNVYSPR
ncbi:MAG TPA: DUF2306 domain-containing protein [Pyrinomonadaceae bacterium]|nr:DUF2306 domain-containing protein [Pyrinomonadaceae bacterium]